MSLTGFSREGQLAIGSPLCWVFVGSHGAPGQSLYFSGGLRFGLDVCEIFGGEKLKEAAHSGKNQKCTPSSAVVCSKVSRRL